MRGSTSLTCFSKTTLSPGTKDEPSGLRPLIPDASKQGTEPSREVSNPKYWFLYPRQIIGRVDIFGAEWMR